MSERHPRAEVGDDTMAPDRVEAVQPSRITQSHVRFCHGADAEGPCNAANVSEIEDRIRKGREGGPAFGERILAKAKTPVRVSAPRADLQGRKGDGLPS